MSHRPRYPLFVVCLVLAALFTSLGFWQLGRLKTRRAGNRLAQAALIAAPIDLNRLVPQSGTLANHRVQVRGVYDRQHEVILRQHVYEEAPGVEVVTPLRIAGSDSAILVNRGFVPSPDAVTADVASLNEPGTVDVRGIAFPIPLSADSGGPISHAGQISWRRLDLAGLRSRIPYPIMAVYIVQSPDSALPRRPIRLDPPPLSNGPHLSYALQWFSFAVIAIVGGWLFAFGKVGSPIGRDPTTP